MVSGANQVARIAGRIKRWYTALRSFWNSYITEFGGTSDIFVFTDIRKYFVPSCLIVPNGIDVDQSFPTLGKMKRLIISVLRRGMDDGTLDPALNVERTARTVILIVTAIVDNVSLLPREERDVRRVREELSSTVELLLRGLSSRDTDWVKLSLMVGLSENGASSST